jgi:hypothetical protein
MPQLDPCRQNLAASSSRQQRNGPADVSEVTGADRPQGRLQPFRASKKPQSSAHLCPIWEPKNFEGALIEAA